ncbi:AfsR/SARP family transcriptional regulator [Intrasporangium flavum]|uniref:AfsR/SARP family transcriptional regulator n=1 Tax=Intrasporangium flavum TaxID=1428657 RepID=UPI001A95F6D1|nr:BTAD domain-containing putative transcriptional regulator [Intrasporangium flavum]
MLISVLGSMRVEGDDGTDVDVGGVKQRAVLAQLALQPNVSVSLDRVAEGVWGEQVPARYRQNVQVYVSTLRRVIEPRRPARTPSRILGHGEAYELVAGPDEIDVLRFRAAAALGRDALADHRPEAAASAFRGALDVWRGDALADLAAVPFAADWVTALADERAAAVEGRIEADLGRGRAAELVAELRALTAQDPGRERLWQHLVLALYRAGRQAEALDAFREARRRLVEDAGIDPGPELSLLADRILKQDPGLLVSAPVVAQDAVGTEVPVPLTAMVGGEAAVSAAAGLVTAGERLVVVTGPGGVGKTRTALAVAARLRREGRVVRWVALEHVTDAEEALGRIAASLPDGTSDGAPDGPGGEPFVLLLDNVEQVGALGPPLRDLLEATPGLTVLATSRSPLGVVGERVVQVEPLPADTDAVSLFRERALAHAPTFTLDTHREAVVRICETLDGLPLAIELVTPRLALFDVEQLADELAAGGWSEDLDARASTHERQGSLHGLVGWSLDLLPAPGRDHLRRIARCPGSVDLEVAVALGTVVGLGPAAAQASVGDLVRASLLRPVESEAGRRFAMLNTVRAVVLADADEPPAAPTGGAERTEVLDVLAGLWVARARARRPLGQPDARATAAARADLPLTWLVLDHLTQAGRGAEAVEILLADRRVHIVLGVADEALRRYAELLDAGLPDGVRQRAMVGAGSAAYGCSDPRAASFLLAVDELDAADGLWRVIGLTTLCALQADEGEADLARAHGAAALATAQAVGDPALLRMAHSAAGWAALRAEDYEAAGRHASAQVQLADDHAATVLALLDLSLAQLFSGDTAAALESCAETVGLARRLGPSYPLAQAYQQLGFALLQADDACAGAAQLVLALQVAPDHHDAGFLLESCAAVGLASVMADGPGGEGTRLLQRANAFALSIFGVDSALSDVLADVASRHDQVASHPGAALPAVGTVADLVASAVAEGERVQGLVEAQTTP